MQHTHTGIFTLSPSYPATCIIQTNSLILRFLYICHLVLVCASASLSLPFIHLTPFVTKWSATLHTHASVTSLCCLLLYLPPSSRFPRLCSTAVMSAMQCTLRLLLCLFSAPLLSYVSSFSFFSLTQWQSN